MDALIEEIAARAADNAVERWGQHLPKGRRLALWRRHRETALETLLAFEEIRTARAIRARAFIGDN